MNRGYVVLNVADKKNEDFTLEWLVEQVEKHKPSIIEINEYQLSILSGGGKAWVTFRDIPLRLVLSGMLGLNNIKKDKQFLLPNELGWQANDEISDLIISKLEKLSAMFAQPIFDPNERQALLKIGVAEIMDEVYDKIKHYQKEKGLLK